MKYAIDRYFPGKEQEVSADEFYGKYIYSKHRRFFCPECGEIVFWRSRGGRKLNDEFYHQTKTEATPECDKRVDGRSDLTVSQRVGLPLYLVRQSSNLFQLNISFPALGTQLCDRAAKEFCTVSISTGKSQKTLPINFINFYADEATLIPIDFIPSGGRNYEIQISTSSFQYQIERKWADYADGFEQGIAIFLQTETGGKKVRRGDSITIGEHYYVVARSFAPYYPEITAKNVGTVLLNSQIFSVYDTVISIDTNNTSRFSIINNYIKSILGVWLVDQTPAVIPLWPPAIESDGYSPVKTTNKLYCSVSSGNSSPSVYTYSNCGVERVPIFDDGKTRSVIFYLGNGAVLASVDRKYVGREIYFANRPIADPFGSFSFKILNKDNEELASFDLSEANIARGFQLNTESKVDLYIESKDKVFQQVPIRQMLTSIPERRNPAALHFFAEGKEIATVSLRDPTAQILTQQMDISNEIKKHLHGSWLPIPRWLHKFITLLEPNAQKLIRGNIANQKIQRGLIVYLFSLKEEINRE